MYGILLAQLGLIASIIALCLLPLAEYFRDAKGLRRFPSVSISGFTDLWGVWLQFQHRRTRTVHDAHLRLGKAVRVGPSHVSFATTEAVKDIYGHGTKAIKDDFYQAFTSTHLNISDAQEKSVHNVKRRRFAQSFAQKTIVGLEPVFKSHLERMLQYVNIQRNKAESETVVDMRHVVLATLYDFHCVTLFQQDPRFLERGSLVNTAETVAGERYEADFYEALTQSSRMATSSGWMPKHMSLLQTLTWFIPQWKSGERLRDMTIYFMRERLRLDRERVRSGQGPLQDLTTGMLWDRDSQPLNLEFGEMVTEATNMFSAAGENTEIATVNTVFFLAGNPGVAKKLQDELEEALGRDRSAFQVPEYEKVKALPYLRACIDETLRLRPSIETGLPRMVPSGGMSVSGEWLQEGTTISVSTHTLHRDAEIWGPEPEAFRPERWLQADSAAMQASFIAFSQGGRGCIGRNIAYFDMQLIIATLFWRFDITLLRPDWDLGIQEAFSAHTLELPVKVASRG